MKSITGLLFPKDAVFFDLLGREGNYVLDGAKLLDTLVKKYNGKLETYRKKIKTVEHDCDVVVQDIQSRLNSSFITPIDHEDIADLASRYDDVLDHIHGVVTKMSVYGIKRVDKPIADFSSLILKSAKELDLAFASMKKLSQKDVDARSIVIHRIENEADEILNDAIAKLFKKKNVIMILKYKEIYEMLEETTDKCEDVIDVFRNIVLKHS